mgnify:CR=1 FL=1|tara:strand:+ start:55 stop:447 length:393 start_codon:yes stop_codon:yes gene_type:complete
MSENKTITPESLIQTNKGEKFFSYSGVQTIDSAGTDMINIDNIGERDIELFVEIGCATNLSSDNMQFTVLMNELIIFQNLTNQVHTETLSGYNELRLIISANSSLRINLSVNTNSYPFTVAVTGNYLEMG